MDNGLEIEIEIRIHQMKSEELPYSVFRKILDALNNSVFESEKRELDIIQEELPNLPDVAFDAAKYRLKKYHYSAILIKELRQGSLIVGCVVAGVALWILKNTLGETLKEAWLESQSHKRLKEFLLKERRHKKHLLATNIVKRIEHAIPSETSIGYNDHINVERVEEQGKIIITIKTKIDYNDYPPNRKDL